MVLIPHHKYSSSPICITGTFALERVHDEKRSGERKYQNRTKGVGDHQEGRDRIGNGWSKKESGFPLNGRDRCLVACAVEGEQGKEG